MSDSVLAQNKNEIVWNLINSGLAAALVMFGALSTGEISAGSLVAALVAGGIVFFTKFKEYWSSEKGEYSKKMFSFIH